MLFLIALAIALASAFFLGKPLKKRPEIFYTAAAVLSAAAFVIERSDVSLERGSFQYYAIGIFTRGAIGAAFWAVVMWTGALPNGSAPIKKLAPIRGELSITAAVLTMSHVTAYGTRYISDIVRNRTGSGPAFRDFVVTSVVCLVMVAIMLPLTVMSIKSVRKKMSAKKWKKIQRFAYLFYALISVHVLFIFIPKARKGAEGYFLSAVVYGAVFAAYAAARVRKYYVMKKKPESRIAANAVCVISAAACAVVIGVVSRKTGGKEVLKATKEAPATFTFEAPTTSPPSSSESAKTTEAAEPASSSDGETVTTSAVTTAPSSAAETTSAASGENTTEAATSREEERLPDEPATEAEQAPEVHEEQPEAPPEEAPVYKFKNGSFEGEGEGYSGKVHVTITIENDYITGFSAYADEDDPEYFSDAMQKVIPQIQRSASADGIDACSGATFSSKGLIEASRNALEKAMN